MKKYIHQYADWPDFSWDTSKITTPLAEVHLQQGALIGRMETLGFDDASSAVHLRSSL